MVSLPVSPVFTENWPVTFWSPSHTVAVPVIEVVYSPASVWVSEEVRPFTV